jgi:hypothetical protein
MVVRTVPASSSSHSGTGISVSPVHIGVSTSVTVGRRVPDPSSARSCTETSINDVVNYIIQKDRKWLTISNAQLNNIVNDFNVCIQQCSRIFVLCAEARLLHDACKEYMSKPLMPGLNDKMNIYDDEIEEAQQIADRLNKFREVLDVLASDFLDVESVARDAIVSTTNACTELAERISTLDQVKQHNEELYERLEEAISFIENVATTKQSECRENISNVPIMLGENNTDSAQRARRIQYNTAAIKRVVFPNTEKRLSRFHEDIINNLVGIIDDLDAAVANANVESIVVQLKSIMYDGGFIDFIATVDDLYKSIK